MARVKKKGQLQQLQQLVVSLVVVGVVISVGFLIIAQAKTRIIDLGGNGSASWNGTLEVQEALGDIPTWLPIIVIVVIGGVLLSLVTIFGRSKF